MLHAALLRRVPFLPFAIAMPNPSMLKHPSSADVFLARTKASDWDWAQQALALGFSPFTALSKETSWALAAARHDRKNGARIATQLVQPLLHTLHTSTNRDAIDALSELGACIAGAIEHENLAFLTALAPSFDALPKNAREKCGQFMGLGIAPSFGTLVWAEVLARSNDKANAKKDWGWTENLPWPTTLVTVNGKLNDLWGVVQRARAGGGNNPSSTSPDLVEHLVNTVGDQITANVLDWAFNTVRHLSPKSWTPNHRDQMETIVNTVARLPNAPALTLDGRDLFQEWKGMIETFPEAERGRLRETTHRWEIALLHKVANDSAGTLEARNRHRL